MMLFTRSKTIIILVFMHFLESVCNGYDPEASITGLYTGPYFDPLAEKNLTAHLGDRAVLPCTVRQLGDKSVSWVRKRDADILTVDRYTFVSDERFEAQYSQPHETWNLVIMYVQERDAGLYECQVSTEPKMSQLFTLRVVVPRVRIVPPGDRFVQASSTVRIDCEITDVVQQPDYIFWYHRGMRVLEQQDPNIDVEVKDTGLESMVSTLTIKSVRKRESGNYTCMPSNLYSASALLHVLEEEHQAAMQGGMNPATKLDPQNRIIIYIVLLILIFQYRGWITFIYKNLFLERKHEHASNQLGALLPRVISPLTEYSNGSNVLHLVDSGWLKACEPSKIVSFEIAKTITQRSSYIDDKRVSTTASEDCQGSLIVSSDFDWDIQCRDEYSKVSSTSSSISQMMEEMQIFELGEVASLASLERQSQLSILKDAPFLNIPRGRR